MLRVILALALVALAVANEGILDCLTGPCVTIPGVGKIQGSKKSTQFTGRDWYGFWAIPFGETTAGANRFQPPVPKAPLNDGKDAFDAGYTNYLLNWMGKMCPQPGVTSEDEGTFEYPLFNAMEQEQLINVTDRGLLDTLGSEDCLHLAVFSPKLPTAAEPAPKLPVMVYIHGGAFYMGGYIGAGPGKLLEQDVVLVEMQYRLGPLGFMCLPEDSIAGNMAMLDQLLALKWVNEHIAAFGGDPDRVTLMGESAGSASATYHMLSPLSQPYFNQVIAESGSALSSWAFDEQPEKHAQDIAASLGCPMDSMDAFSNCLRNERTAAEIVIAHKKYYQAERVEGRLGFGGSSPCAQTHGAQKFITQHPKDILMQALVDGTKFKPALLGSNKHEGSFVLGMMYNAYFLPNELLTDTFFLRHLFISTLLSAMGLQDSSGNIYEMLEYSFFNHEDMGVWDTMMEGMINLVGTFFIKASTYEFMKYNELTGSDSYYYSFEYYGQNSLWNALFPNEKPPIEPGVTHGDEMLYLFSTGMYQFSDEDWDIAYKITNLWTNFAIYGNPTPVEATIEGVPVWPAWEPLGQNYMIIDTTMRTENNYVMTWANPDRIGI